MEFHDGARSVRVHIHDGELVTDSGAVVNAEADWQKGGIRLAGDGYLAPDARLSTLNHELAHWYIWSHGGPPTDIEELCDWMSGYATWLDRQYAKNAGMAVSPGDAMLRRLKPGGGTMTPGEALELGHPVSAEEPYATQCPGCGCLVAGGSVVRSVAVPSSAGVPVVWMAMMCHECGELWRWSCAAEGGRSTTAVVDEPERVTDRVEIARFITAHPSRAGALQA